MTGGILIRPACRQDVGVLVEFNIAMAMETEQKKLARPVVLKGVENALSDDTKGFYLVAQINGDCKPVGVLMVTYEWSDWRNSFFWWIQSVYVSPLHRQKKIFTALFRAVAAMAKQKKNVCGLRLYVEKENATAQKVYSGLGMKKTSYDLYEISF